MTAAQSNPLLNQLSQVDYNPANYVAGSAPTAPVSQMVILGLVLVGIWLYYSGHGGMR